MSLVPFIVIRSVDGHILRCGMCQPEMVDSQVEDAAEEGVLVSLEEMQDAKAMLRQAFDAAMQLVKERLDEES